jgi:hypothetical protein
MRVIQETTHRLTLQLRPWGLWILGGIFGLVGLIPSFFLGSQRLVCDRLPAPGHCDLTQATLWQRRTQTWPLADLKAAEIETSSDDEGDPLYRIVLQRKEGSIPFRDYYSSDALWHKTRAARINQFLQDPTEPQLVLEHHDFWFPFLFGAGFLGVGLLIIGVFGEIITADFDKSTHQFTLTRRGLQGTQRVTHPLSSIVRLRIESDRSSKGSKTYCLHLVLSSGESLALTPYFSSGLPDKTRLGEQIATFLNLGSQGVSLEDPAPTLPNLKELFTLVTGNPQQREQAIATYRNRIQQNPEDIEAHAQLAMALIVQGRETEARRHLAETRRQFLAEGKSPLADQITALIAHLDDPNR